MTDGQLELDLDDSIHNHQQLDNTDHELTTSVNPLRFNFRILHTISPQRPHLHPYKTKLRHNTSKIFT